MKLRRSRFNDRTPAIQVLRSSTNVALQIGDPDVANRTLNVCDPLAIQPSELSTSGRGSLHCSIPPWPGWSEAPKCIEPFGSPTTLFRLIRSILTRCGDLLFLGFLLISQCGGSFLEWSLCNVLLSGDWGNLKPLFQLVHLLSECRDFVNEVVDSLPAKS